MIQLPRNQIPGKAFGNHIDVITVFQAELLESIPLLAADVFVDVELHVTY